MRSRISSLSASHLERVNDPKNLADVNCEWPRSIHSPSASSVLCRVSFILILCRLRFRHRRHHYHHRGNHLLNLRRRPIRQDSYISSHLSFSFSLTILHVCKRYRKNARGHIITRFQICEPAAGRGVVRPGLRGFCDFLLVTSHR